MAVWLRRFATDLVRRRERVSRSAGRDNRALLLSAQQNQRQVVGACCGLAGEAGVHPGMALGEARALFDADDLRIERHDPELDAKALSALAVWAQRFSPTVATDPPDGLLLDITGCERVFGGEPRLVERAGEAFRSLGFACRIATAPTFGGAWAFSRFGDQGVVTDGELEHALAGLPVSALALDEETVAGLDEVGVGRIGELMRLPRSAVAARFGDGVLLRLDRATGDALETIEAFRPDPPPGVERLFDGPTGKLDAIELTVRGLLAELSGLLREREAGARLLVCDLERSDLEPARVSAELAHPSRDAKHLHALLWPAIEKTHLGFGVEAVRLCAPSIGPLRLTQLGAAGAHEGPGVEREVGRLVDTLAARFGHNGVLRAGLRESWNPERAVEMRSVVDRRKPVPARAVGRDRPTWLFARPLAAKVVALTPDGPVHRVQWRGGDVETVECIGPERIEPEWWRGDGAARDYFAVRAVDGRWLWISRGTHADSINHWSVCGVWA